MNAEESLAPVFPEELPWLAFLYVSEELSPDDAADFEERLLTDQAAREAVAAAMKMADGLWMAAALSSLNSAPHASRAESKAGQDQAGQDRRWSRLILWVGSTIVAAGLAFCVGWWFALPGDSPNSSAPIADQNDPKDPQSAPKLQTGFLDQIAGAEKLVGIWSNSQALLVELGSDPEAEYSSETSEGEPQEPEDDAFAWMLAAVSADAPDDPQIQPDVMEN
jgi:anti-sigma factor RsiW